MKFIFRASPSSWRGTTLKLLWIVFICTEKDMVLFLFRLICRELFQLLGFISPRSCNLYFINLSVYFVAVFWCYRLRKKDFVNIKNFIPWGRVLSQLNLICSRNQGLSNVIVAKMLLNNLHRFVFTSITT